MNFIPQPQEQEVVGGKHNILILYVDASASDPSGVVLCNPFKWDIVLFILTENHMVQNTYIIPMYIISFFKHTTR